MSVCFVSVEMIVNTLLYGLPVAMWTITACSDPVNCNQIFHVLCQVIVSGELKKEQ